MKKKKRKDKNYAINKKRYNQADLYTPLFDQKFGAKQQKRGIM